MGIFTVSANADLFSQRVTLDVENAELRSVLRSLREQSGYMITYSEDKVGGDNARVTASFADVELQEALELVLRDLPYTFSVSDRRVFIIPAPEKIAQQPAMRSVAGLVRDRDGVPMAGVSVVLKGTTRGTATDASGSYAIDIPAGTQTLVFSFVGFQAQEIEIADRTASMNVTMEESATAIDDVVVTGIFVRARESYTGSVTSITPAELQQYKGQNLIRTIANIDPALNIMIDNTYGSDPNRLPDMTIRGSSSLPRSLEELNENVRGELNAPLIIVNGFPVSLQKLMDFNDENVESINILKDASATAIYGSRGANGVIVITTRRPAEGSLRVNVRAGLNLEIPDLSSYNLMNAAEKLRVEEAAGFYSDVRPLENNEWKALYYEKVAALKRGVDTYWLAQPLRTGVGQNYNVDLSYGTEVFQVGVNLGYNMIAGVMKDSGRDTFSGTVDLQYNYRNLSFKNQTSIDINNATNSPYGSFAESARMNPYWEMNDEDGNPIPRYRLMLNDTYATNSRNIWQWASSPVYNASLNSIDRSDYHTIHNNFSIEWGIAEGLKFIGSLGLNWSNSTSDRFVPLGHTEFMAPEYQTADNIFRKGRYTYSNGESNGYETNLQLNYTKLWNDRHLLVAGVNYSMQQDNSLDYIIIAEGFTNDDINYLPGALQYSQVQQRPEGVEGISRSVGFTGNVNYTYDDRYYVDLSYRLDGSSIFGADNKFAPFWSAGIGWNIHNENFMGGSSLFQRLKLRASVGETGSQQFDPYMAQMTFSYDPSQRYITWSGAGLMGLGNPALKWQSTFESNVGIEADMLDRRLRLMLDIYDKKTDDLLSSMDIPWAHGFKNYVANVGEVSNRGFEASVQGVILRNPDRNLQWSVTAKMAYNKNEITKLSQAIKDQTALAMENDVDSDLLFEGHSSNGIYAVPSLGIDPSTGQEIFLDREGNLVMEQNWKAGYRRYYGSTEPKYRGNISSYLSYGNLSLSLSFAYYWGGRQYNNTLMEKVEVTRAGLEWNVDRRVYEQRWLREGDVRFFKAFSNTRTRQSSRFVMDDNVFQLQTVNLTYRWRAPFLERAGIELLNLSFNMSDVFYLSSIKRERGTAYPFSRKAGLTLNFQF